MDYIINPMWFYWLSVADGLKTFFIVATVILGALCIVFFIVACVHKSLGSGYSEDDEDNVKAKICFRIVKLLIIVSSVCAVASIFIPSRNTLIEMQVAKFATYENAEWTIDTIKSAVDYIVQSINSLK